MEHYLDNAATTMVCDEAAQAALAAMTENYGNPSSTHAKGREANRLLETARKQVSAALGCTPGELIFTSCGSESDNWAIINGAEAMKRKGKHIISSAVEHDAVRRSLDELESRGFEVTRLAPDEKGGISLDSVVSALRDDTILVSLMLVNNETGAVTDISSIAKAVKKACPAALVHTDAVQGFMKVPFSAKSLGADMISISGHKIHAPKGVGALYVKNGVKLKPFIVGGSQENGRRAGTEAMPQIAAFGAACEIARAGMAENIARMQSLRERAVERLSREIPELVLIGGGSPHILSISLPGWRSEVLMNYLEAKEVYVSRSSACKKGGRSHVLEAMGLSSRVIDGAIRIGLSRFTTEEDIDALCAALKEAHDTLAHR
ncbi:MAG: cysteine desulfurase family protein [Candidatus Limivicinus sp.]|nr:cysteine desulfurase family protein [Candidatus Limivicinus sp.]